MMVRHTRVGVLVFDVAGRVTTERVGWRRIPKSSATAMLNLIVRSDERRVRTLGAWVRCRDLNVPEGFVSAGYPFSITGYAVCSMSE